jgi:hypothetical protein
VARPPTAQIVNAGLVLLYWSIGTRIRQDILKQKRAKYGDEIVPTLSAQLEAEIRARILPRELVPHDQIC